ncbi:MAG: carboxypeptidase-like regulatory domain-containing protein [Myxococcota bacterium]
MIAILLACSGLPDTILVTGTVTDAPKGQGSAVEGATVTSLDEDGLVARDPTPRDEATTYEDGSFVVEAVAGEDFFLTVSKDGYVPTSWSGSAGFVDLYTGDGVPWIAEEAWVEALRDELPDCVAEGAVVTGEVRQLIDGLDYDELPIVALGAVTVTDADGARHEACYFDDEGVADPDATHVGETGRFAVFGLPEGPLVVEVTIDDPAYTSVFAQYRYRAVEGGLVPMFPALLRGL